MKTKIFISCIDFLNEQEIPYVLLGNINTYPDKIGSDVDRLSMKFLMVEKLILRIMIMIKVILIFINN